MPIVIDGGKPLKGCPKSWEEAHEWENEVNGSKEEISNVVWKYDCGFKLDYDGGFCGFKLDYDGGLVYVSSRFYPPKEHYGGLVYVSSRFYPPKEHFGKTWDGIVTIFILGNKVIEKAFDCKTLEELREQVETYVNSIAEKIKSAICKDES